MRSGARIVRERLLVGFRKRVHPVLGHVPARRGERAGEERAPPRARRAPPIRTTRRRTATPRRIQIAASARPRDRQRDARSARRRAAPGRAGTRRPSPSACSRRARSQMPPCTAAMKLMIQVPTVTLSVRIAAVDGCSVSDAAAARERDRQAGIEQVAERRPSPAPARRRCRRSCATAATATQRRQRGDAASRRAARAPSPRCARAPASAAAARASARRSGDRRRPGGWRQTAAGTPPPARRR